MLGLEFSSSQMLRFLRIRRLAVIDSVEVEFDPGLNVLTGETGAGKSILVEAVGLLLGGRASGDLVRTGEDAATIEAIFESGGEELIVRREITAQGRSRAFVNGDARDGRRAQGSRRPGSSSCTASTNIRRCSIPSTHLGVLDAFAGLEPLAEPSRRRRSRRCATPTTSSPAARTSLAERDSAAGSGALPARRTRQGARSSPARTRSLRRDAQVLASAERVERLCAESYAALYERDDAVLATLGGVWRRVAELAALDPQFRPYLDARDAHQVAARGSGAASCGATPTASTPRRRGCSRSRIGWRCSSGSSASTARRWPTSSRSATRSASELERSASSGEERIAALERELRARPATATWPRRAACARRVARLATRVRARARARRSRELAMERTRFEVRFGDDLPENGVDRARASTRRSSSCRRTSARSSGRWRASSRAASSRASCWRSRR